MIKRFLDALAKMHRPHVLELGTRAWFPHQTSHHRREILEANPQAQYLGTDLLAGDCVDYPCDAHELSKHFGRHFDAFLCTSTLEHCRRPWIVSAELAQVVREGGIGFVETHQSFPVHGYPSDFFRFTREAMAELFAPDVGWEMIESGYEHPCRVVPMSNVFAHARDWNFDAPAFLNVWSFVRRI